MATVEERLARLEARVEEHSQLFGTMREALLAFEHRMDVRFDGIERRFDAVDRRFDAVDRRFEAIDRRFETLDAKFVWLIGLYVTSVIAFAIAAFTRS
jgi:tetrahydromethanopterin S-methyltransferase subunit G